MARHRGRAYAFVSHHIYRVPFSPFFSLSLSSCVRTYIYMCVQKYVCACVSECLSDAHRRVVEAFLFFLKFFTQIHIKKPEHANERSRSRWRIRRQRMRLPQGFSFAPVPSIFCNISPQRFATFGIRFIARRHSCGRRNFLFCRANGDFEFIRCNFHHALIIETIFKDILRLKVRDTLSESQRGQKIYSASYIAQLGLECSRRAAQAPKLRLVLRRSYCALQHIRHNFRQQHQTR